MTALAATLSLAFALGGVTPSGDAAVARDLRAGLQLRPTHALRAREVELRNVITRLRRDKPSSAAGRHARQLAITGFADMLASVRAELDFYANDSGEIAAATRDATRAARARAAGEERLVEAARLLGVGSA